MPTWVSIRQVENKNYLEILNIEVDRGEASAIALAIESNNALLILDDYKARKLAQKLNLNYTGTLGVLLKAKELEIIPDLKSILLKVQQTNFRFSAKLFAEIIEAANES